MDEAAVFVAIESRYFARKHCPSDLICLRRERCLHVESKSIVVAIGDYGKEAHNFISIDVMKFCSGDVNDLSYFFANMQIFSQISMLI
jgi:hypothetical protein